MQFVQYKRNLIAAEIYWSQFRMQVNVRIAQIAVCVKWDYIT